MIRIGSCGSLQPQVKVGDIIIVNGAVRDDGTSKHILIQHFLLSPTLF